jgi:hypothetical protein
MDRISRGQQCFSSLFGRPQGRCSGHDGFSDPSLSSEKDVFQPGVFLHEFFHILGDLIHGLSPIYIVLLLTDH